MREQFFDDPTDQSTYRGEGGRVIIPNTRASEDMSKLPIRPNVGPSRSKPLQIVTDSEPPSVAKRRQRSGDSKSSSGSQTLIPKPKKKAPKPSRSSDVSGNESTRSRRGLYSRVGIDDITEAQRSAAEATPDPMDGPATQENDERKTLVDAWNLVTNNADNVLRQILKEMLVGTNSTMVIGAAWSIHSHLIPGQWNLFGPLYYGKSDINMV